MKSKIKWTFWVCIVTIVLWIFSWIAPAFIPSPTDDTLHFYNVLFTAATALFTGIAFVVAYFSISKQQELLQNQQNAILAQTRLTVLSETMRLVMDSDRFIKSRKYILSLNYYNDIKIVKDALDIKGKVGLEDFQTILVKGLRKNWNMEVNLEALLEAYENITFFCARMDYLGSVSEEESVTDIVIDQYGLTIIESYKVLSHFIERSREQSNHSSLYEHYSKLYDEANKRLKARLLGQNKETGKE